MRIQDLLLDRYLFETKGETLIGLRFSHKDDLSFFDSSKHGGGIRGAERKRLAAHPELYNSNRVYFYIEDDFRRKEPGLGRYAYRAILPNLYNSKADPLRLKKQALEKSKELNSGYLDNLLAATLFENLILENKFDGYFDRGVIIYFKDAKEITRVPEYDG